MIREDATEIYEQYIKLLPAAERLRLLALVARDLASEVTPSVRPAGRSIMALHGLGKEIWEGIDPQEYVNKLRQEWDHGVLLDEA